MQKLQKPRQGYKLVKSYFGKYEEIPSSWKYDELKNSAKITDGAHNSPEKVLEGFPMATIENMRSNQIDVESCYRISKKDYDYLVKNNCKPEKGDVLFTKDGTVGESLVFNQTDDLVLLSSIAIIRPNTNIDSKFCNYSLQSKFMNKHITKYLGGTAIKRIVLKHLEKFEFPLPSILEQQKIASILSNVDSLINQTQKEIEQIQRLKKGLMKKLLTKGIGHTKFKKVKSIFGKYDEIPEQWILSKMKDVCKKISVGIATSTTKYFVDTGIPLLRNQNIKEGYIETNDLLHITEQFAKMNESKKIHEGDVICMRTGYPGQSAVVPSEMNGWQTFTTLIVRPNHEILDSNYLSMFMNSIGRKQITSVQAGAAQQNLNAGWLSNMSILVPTLKEQQKIASILSNVDSKIQKQQEYKSKLESLKKGLMQKLLTGQIRVKI